MSTNSSNSSGDLHRELVSHRPTSSPRPSQDASRPRNDGHVHIDIDAEASRNTTVPLNAHQNADVLSLHSQNPNLQVAAVGQKAWQQLLGKNPFKTSYFSLYRPLKTWQDKCILVVAVICSLAGGVPLPIIGVLFGKMINTFPPEPDALKVKLTQLMCVAVAYFCITWIWATCWGLIGERVSRGLREAVLEKSIGMDIGWFETEGCDIAQRLTADTQTIQLGTSEKVGIFIQSIAYFLAAFTTGFILNARLTGILFAGVIPAMTLVVMTGTHLVSKLARRAAAETEKGASIAEGSIAAVKVVQAFGAMERLVGEYSGYLSEAARLGIWRGVAGAVMLGSVYFVAYAANALAFWEGSRLIYAGKGEGAGTVYTVVFLILDASFVLGSFGPFIQTFALAAAAGEKILAILDTPSPDIDVYSTSGESFPEGKNDFVLDNVTFVYPSRPTVRVLDGVSLTLEEGKVTALVGSSGSGKSTIIGLLLRFYDPAFGRVKLGSKDIKDLNLASYRSKLALVEQEPILFTGTILENIEHGLLSRTDYPDLTTEQKRKLALEAARDANAYDFINSLPNGFDTIIGGAASTALSGGQKQRIALARALVSDPKVLLLDEPTSALDSTSEAIILDALARAQAKEGRTTIMIAHRLATVRNADKIVVMSGGKVLEEGGHDELMEKGAAYAGLVRAQRFVKEVEGGSSGEQTAVGTPTASGEKLVRFEDEKAEKTAVSESKNDKEDDIPFSAGEVISRSLALSRPDLPWIFLGLAASIVTGGIVLGEAVIFGNLISVLNDNSNQNMLKDAAFFSLMFFILSLIALAAFTTSGSAFGIVSERLIRRVREKSFRTILRMDIEWFTDGRSASSLMSMLNMDAGQLSGLSGVILGTIFSVCTSMIGGIILAHIVAWRIAVVLLAAVPVMLVSGFLRLRILSKFEERHQTAYVKAAGLATEACGAMKTVSALGLQATVLAGYRREIEGPYKASLKFITFGNLWLAFALAITYFVYALAYYWGARNVREGYSTTLDFFIVLPALLFSAQASGQMFSLAPEVTRAKTAARSIFKLHDQKGKIDLESDLLPTAAIEKTEKTTTETKGATVDFKNVSFSYSSRPDSKILHDLSLTIAPGSFVAFVGASGAGKSTALSLLARFYDPTSGTILLDGQDIKSLPVSKHRERLSLVTQEACLFPGTILFNVGLGKSPSEGPATLEEVQHACSQVGLHSFIMSLPDGYQTQCGTNGTLLSGGQKQRLSIARALMRNPTLLLLDEATSALDSHSEKEVQKAIEEAGRGRTTVVVAHRLSTVQRADWIWVFEGGRVVEGGTHEGLVRSGGVYAGMKGRQDLE